MSIGKDTVRYVARQAHLDLPEQKLEQLEPELSGILEWIEQLSELDTEDVEPLANISDTKLHLRQDKVTDGGRQKDVLANAPEDTEGYFVVKKIVE